jgi:spermidine synthase
MKPSAAILTILAAYLAGAVSLIVEIAGAHVLAPGFGMGLNAWAAMLVVTLTGLSVGYLAGGAVAERWRAQVGGRLLPSVLVLVGLGLCADALLWNRCVLALAEAGPRFGALLAAGVLFAVPFVLLGAVYPLTLRLWATSNNVAWRGGTLSALSTFGALSGALLVGYVLVPRVSIEALFGGSAIALFVVSAGLALAHRGVTSGLVGLAFCLLPALCPSPASAPGHVWGRASMFGPIEVVDRGDARFLLVAGTIQGAGSPDRGESLFPYVSVLGAMLQENALREPEGKVLLVGLGAGFLPRLLESGRCETVEIDPAMVEAAAGPFGFDLAGNVVHVADGRAFMLTSQERYAAIVFDAYGGGSHPWHLLTRESFALARERLRPGGMLVVNFLGYVSGENDELVRALEATLRAVFSEVEIFASPVADDYANVIFVAHEGRSRVLWNEDLYQRRGSFLEGRSAQVVTDSLNPIALWSAAVEHRWRDESRRMLRMGGEGE